MKKIIKLLPFILIIIFSTNFLAAAQRIDIKLKFYKGIKKDKVSAESKVITSYTLTPFFTGNIISKTKLPDERKELKEIFNLQDVELLTEADLIWRSSSGEKVFQVINLNGSDYLVLLTPNWVKKAHKFRVEVYEGMKAREQKNLIDVEIILPRDNIAVIGFLDSKGNPYFLSFRVTGGVIGGVVGGVIGGKVKKEQDSELKEPIRIGGKIKPPRLVRKVRPIYPEKCKKDGIEGIVILEATTDKEGNIVNVKVLKPAHPDLNKAAIEAVKQWKYEPTIINGKPVSIVFTVTVSFKLK
ncbi:MAG: energy transducer TonB [Candidatus Aminicenantia bacterium]